MSYVSEVLADSPVVYYRMNEISMGPQDSSGNGNHVNNVVGTPNYGQQGGIPSDSGDTSILLSHVNPDYFTAPDHATLDVGDVFTLEAWVKRTRTGSSLEEGIITKGQDAGGLYILNDAIMLAKSGVAVIVSSTSTITDTTNFHHIVATKNGATVKLYHNAVDVTGSVSNQTCASTTAVLEIGSEFGGSFPVSAYLDEIAVYATALSAARVSAHYDAALAADITMNYAVNI